MSYIGGTLAFLTNLLMVGFVLTFGAQTAGLVESISVSTVDVALISGIHTACIISPVLILLAYGRELSEEIHCVMFASGAMTWATGIISSCFVESYIGLLVLAGVMSGIGGGLMIFAIIPYIHERYEFAVISGVECGMMIYGMAIAPHYTSAQGIGQRNSWRGIYLILGLVGYVYAMVGVVALYGLKFESGGGRAMGDGYKMDGYRSAIALGSTVIGLMSIPTPYLAIYWWMQDHGMVYTWAPVLSLAISCIIGRGISTLMDATKMINWITVTMRLRAALFVSMVTMYGLIGARDMDAMVTVGVFIGLATGVIFQSMWILYPKMYMLDARVRAVAWAVMIVAMATSPLILCAMREATGTFDGGFAMMGTFQLLALIGSMMI